jgi:membrane-associated phospholipid phosphatase
VVSPRRLAVTLPLFAREHAAGWRTPLRNVDLLLLAYLAIVSAVAVMRLSSQPGCWWLLLAHALFVLLLFLMTRPGLGRVGRTIRELYPIILLPGFYGELDVLSSPARPVHDLTVQHWEQLIFGMQVSREWWQRVPSVFLSTVFHTAYLSYYLIVAAPALYLAWKGNLNGVRHFVLAVMTTFVICYLFFIFFPVAGPYYVFPRPAEWFLANLPARWAYGALSAGSSYGAAFPSSHVAAALTATLAAKRASRWLGLILLVPTILLTLGVVYCQMHYGIDALTGVVVGGGVTHLLERNGAA